jgi:regulatory protein
MIVSALKQKGNNVIVQFDNGESLILDYRTVIDNGLRKNDSINESRKEKLIEASNLQKVKDSAFRLLSRRHHSVSELRTKLYRKDVKKELIEEVISSLLTNGFLDDEKFAVSFVEERTNKKVGKHKIKAELIKRGVQKAIIDKAIGNIDSEDSFQSAMMLAKKKLEYIERKEKDKRKIKAKLYSFLNARGYENEIVMKVLREVKLEYDEEEIN